MAFSIRKAFRSCRLRREFIELFFINWTRVSNFLHFADGLVHPMVELFRFPSGDWARMIRRCFM
jgi:hypothetical protein